MKEATGDMTMTIVVIVGVVAVLGIGGYIWNIIQNRIETEVNNIGSPIDTPTPAVSYYVEQENIFNI